jgi:hypothetical protein
MLLPFCGWRYDPGRIDLREVLAPPARTLDENLRRELYRRHTKSIVRLTGNRFFDSDGRQDNVLTRAASTLDCWRSEGTFLRDRPAFYLLRQEFMAGGESYSRVGVFCRILLKEWSEAVIPHEIPEPTLDVEILQRLRALRGQIEPVRAVIADEKQALEKCLDTMAGYQPLLKLELENRVDWLWVVDHHEQCLELQSLSAGKVLRVVGGHDLYVAALVYRNEVRQALKNAGQTPPALGMLESDYLMALIWPYTLPVTGKEAVVDRPSPVPSPVPPVMPPVSWDGMVLHLFW